MNKIFSMLLIPSMGILISCNEVEFERNVQSAIDSNTVESATDPNFDDDGIYLDNPEYGALISEIITELSSDAIGLTGGSVTGDTTCVKANGILGCYANSNSQIFVGDSFERDDAAPQDNIFSWRTIINDNGNIVDGTSANNVELKPYDDSILGEASEGNKSLYFTGRAGAGSVHNLYLVTRSFDLSETNGIVYFSFDYLPIGLEKDEYFKLEVCNDNVDECGVGENISVAGLNSNSWKTIFQSDGSEVRDGLNGFNHVKTDWINKQMAIRLDGFQRDNFVFRINAFMNEGFYENNPSNGVDDAVGIDNFKAFTFLKK